MARRQRLKGALALVLALVGSAPGRAEKKPPEPYALMVGSVFDDRGFSLRGAQVTVAAALAEKPPKKFKTARLATDARGEFTIRLPAAPYTYKVTVSAAGFLAQEKLVPISGDERVDVFFQLERAP